MMKKQNRNPNPRSEMSSKSNLLKGKPMECSHTPDANTSRTNFRPRFIKKDPNFDEQFIKSKSQHSQFRENNDNINTFMNSPVSLTEKNTLLIDQVALHQDKKINYMEKYREACQQLQSRTGKFNTVIELCTKILEGIKEKNQSNRITSIQKIEFTAENIDYVLNAFKHFQMDK